MDTRTNRRRGAVASLRALVPVLFLVCFLAANAASVEAASQITHRAELIASDGAEGDLGGWSVDIDGTRAIMGARDATTTAPDSGSAYVFEWTGTRWREEAELAPTGWTMSQWDRFGKSVAISGDMAAVGAPYSDETTTNGGAVFTFLKSSQVWEVRQRIEPPDTASSDAFGEAIAMDGDTLVIGAPEQNEARLGAAYVYTRSGDWYNLQQKLTASDGAAGDYFGLSVAIDGDTIVVGRPQDGNQGSVYVFTRSGSTWTQRAKIPHSDPAAGDQFGAAVAVDESVGTIVVAAPWKNSGRGEVQVLTGSGATWSYSATLLEPSAANNDNFGYSVGIDSDTIVVGASGHDGSYTNSGALWAFGGSGSSWAAYPRMLGTDYTGETFLGTSAAISGDRIIGGARGDGRDPWNVARTGSAHVFELAAGSSPLTYWDNGVSVTFNQVNAPGTFVATPRFESVNATPTSHILTDRTLFDLNNTVSYTGTFTVSIPYDEDNVPNWLNVEGPISESDLKMLHWDGEGWVDITASVDTTANRVYGVASSFSEFGLGESGTATDSPYFSWDTTANAGTLLTPHKDYRTTTKKCGVCHAVHEAKAGGEMLLPTTVANACVYCHITTSIGGIIVYGGDPDAYTIESDYGHNAEGGALCVNCHSVHGSNTLGGDAGLATKILRAGDYQAEFVSFIASGNADAITNGTTGGGPQDWDEVDVQWTGFCTRCHENYAHTATQTIGTGYSTHPMRDYFDPEWPDPDVPDIIGKNLKVADYSTRGCSWWCHYAPRSWGNVGVNVQSLPHYNPGYDKFLIAAESLEDPWWDVPAADSDTDDVCIYCHRFGTNGGSGVGLTY